MSNQNTVRLVNTMIRNALRANTDFADGLALSSTAQGVTVEVQGNTLQPMPGPNNFNAGSGALILKPRGRIEGAFVITRSPYISGTEAPP